MSGSLFITATEARSGKSAISLGVIEMLMRKIDRVGFFRPIINVDPSSGKRDNDIGLISSHFKLEIPYEKMYGYTTTEANNLISRGREAEILEGIIKKYTIELDNKKIGKALSAYILITVDYKLLKQIKKTQHELATKLKSHPSVEEADTVTGATDIMIKVKVKDIEELNDFITNYVRNLEGVEKTRTTVILSEA